MEIDVKQYRTIISHHLITYISDIFTIEHQGPALPAQPGQSHVVLPSTTSHVPVGLLSETRIFAFWDFDFLCFRFPESATYGKSSTNGRFHDTKSRDAYLVGIDDPFHFLVYIYCSLHRLLPADRPMAKIRRTWDLENPVQLQEFIQFNSITTIKPS